MGSLGIIRQTGASPARLLACSGTWTLHRLQLRKQQQPGAPGSQLHREAGGAGGACVLVLTFALIGCVTLPRRFIILVPLFPQLVLLGRVKVKLN